MQKKLHNTWQNTWRRDYMRDGVFHPESYGRLRSIAAAESAEFIKGNRKRTFDQAANLEEFSLYWLAGAEGQQTLQSIVKDLHSFVDHHKYHALPAHDARQILFKDAAESLRFSTVEKPVGTAGLFVIPTFSHDVGRLVEGRLYDPDLPHDQWIPHAQLSFLIIRDILESYAIPKAIENDFLYAVLAHSGDNGATYMSRALQTCDRMQLIGAEGLFRALSYVPCLMGGDIAPHSKENLALPDIENIHDSVTLLEFYGRNMRPNIGKKHATWQQEMQIQNTMILLSLCEWNDQILYPERHKITPAHLAHNKKPIPQNIFNEAQKRLIDSRFENTHDTDHGDDVMARIIQCLETPKGAAPLQPVMKDRLHRAVQKLIPEQLWSLQRALHVATILQNDLDRQDRILLENIMQDEHANPIHHTIASKALEFAPSPNIKPAPSERPAAQGQLPEPPPQFLSRAFV